MWGSAEWNLITMWRGVSIGFDMIYIYFFPYIYCPQTSAECKFLSNLITNFGSGYVFVGFWRKNYFAAAGGENF